MRTYKPTMFWEESKTYTIGLLEKQTEVSLKPLDQMKRTVGASMSEEPDASEILKRYLQSLRCYKRRKRRRCISQELGK